MGFLSRSFTGLVAAAGLASASQMPEFAQQYRQRLGGAVEELRVVVEDFDRDAQNSQMTRRQAIDSLNDTGDDKLFKFALNLSDDYVSILMADIERLHHGAAAATSSGHGSVDLIVPGLHKANGLRLLQTRWGIADEEVMAFGDGGNDLEMLVQSGFSFAMQNAPQRVKQAARYQAPSNNDQGVLQVIEQMLAGQGPFHA